VIENVLMSFVAVKFDRIVKPKTRQRWLTISLALFCYKQRQRQHGVVIMGER